MPDQNNLPLVNALAGSDPQSYADLITKQNQIERRKAMAQMLLQQSLTPQQTEVISGRAVPVSPLAAASKFAQALVAGGMFHQNDRDTSDIALAQGRMMGPMFGIPSPQAQSVSAATQPAAQSDPAPQGSAQPSSPASPAPTIAADGGPIQGVQIGNDGKSSTTRVEGNGPTTTPLSNAASANGPASARGPLQMPGMSPGQSMMTYSANPQAYISALLSRSDNRTDFTKNLISAGVDPSSPQGQSLIMGNIQKANSIEMRPNGLLLDPATGTTTTAPSPAPNGFQNVQLADGSWGVVPVRAGTEAISQSAAATKAGEAPYQIVNYYQDGKPMMGYAGNVLTMPKGSAAPSAPPSAAPPSAGPGISQQMGTPGSTQTRLGGLQSGPALGEAKGAESAQAEMSDAWNKQVASHQVSQTNISLLRNIQGLADKAVTGAESDRRLLLTKLGAFAGLGPMDDKASATDLFNKYGSQLIAGLSAKGMNTDAARDIVMAGTPNSHMQPSAIREAASAMIAREEMNQARTVALQKQAIARNPSAYQSTAIDFDSVADPRLWQMRSMSQPQLVNYINGLDPSDAGSLLKKYTAAKDRGFLQ